jgi:hypothetical protein
MDIVSGTALAKQALENVRSILEIAQKFGDVELKRRIVNLEDQISELARERRTLAEENDELKKALQRRAETSFRNPYWYEEGNEVPLCPKCYEASEYKLRIYLTHPAEPWNGGHRRHCKNCGLYFYDEGVTPKVSPVRLQRRGNWRITGI